MIRRDDGTDWLLISQPAHAGLAAEIAQVWNRGDLTEMTQDQGFLAAVRRHDDGWDEWERFPTVDSQTGKPRDFTEMPMPVATEIWDRSIERSAGQSDWAGLWVSRHFCYLAEKATQNRKEGTNERGVLQRFLEEQQRRQTSWRRSLRRDGDDAVIRQREEQGYRGVQFFDRISLWLCCARRFSPVEFEVPGGRAVRFTPCAGSLIEIEPPSLTVDRLELCVPARRIPATPFADDAALRAAIRFSPAEELTWIVADAKR